MRVVAGAVAGLVIAVLALGSWLGSRIDSDADSVADGGRVTASAVVVSSLACVSGSGQTLLDVLTPNGSGPGAATVRANLDGCGYQEGEQLAVQYRPGEPSNVTLADTDSGAGTGSGALLPLGLTVAGLLAVGAALAVYADGRGALRRRHAAGPDGRRLTNGDDQPTDPGSPSAPGEPADDAPTWEDAVEREDPEDLSAGHDGRWRHRARRGARARVDASMTGWDFFAEDAFPADPESTQFPDHNGHGPFTAAQARTMSPVDTVADLPLRDAGTGSEAVSGSATVVPRLVDDRRRQREISSVNLIFPSSSELAASLHDELFTHRSVSG